MIPTRLPTLVLALLLAAPATAGADYWAWETDEGTLAFADDEKHVPARYRDRAERRKEAPLVDYERLTIVPRAATTVASQPDVAAAPPAHAMPPTDAQRGRGEPTIRLQLGGNAALEIPAESDEPLIVKRGRFSFDEDGFGKGRMIVKQGDRILAEIENY